MEGENACMIYIEYINWIMLLFLFGISIVNEYSWIEGIPKISLNHAGGFDRQTKDDKDDVSGPEKAYHEGERKEKARWSKIINIVFKVEIIKQCIL